MHLRCCGYASHNLGVALCGFVHNPAELRQALLGVLSSSIVLFCVELIRIPSLSVSGCVSCRSAPTLSEALLPIATNDSSNPASLQIRMRKSAES